MSKPELKDGHHKLSCWFGLSYASFLTMPRVLMEAMPDEWQGKMADLLDEADEEFYNFPGFKYRVQRVEGNRLASFPSWLLNYRHPDYKKLDEFRNYRTKGEE